MQKIYSIHNVLSTHFINMLFKSISSILYNNTFISTYLENLHFLFGNLIYYCNSITFLKVVHSWWKLMVVFFLLQQVTSAHSLVRCQIRRQTGYSNPEHSKLQIVLSRAGQARQLLRQSVTAFRPKIVTCHILAKHCVRTLFLLCGGTHCLYCCV